MGCCLGAGLGCGGSDTEGTGGSTSQQGGGGSGTTTSDTTTAAGGRGAGGAGGGTTSTGVGGGGNGAGGEGGSGGAGGGGELAKDFCDALCFPTPCDGTLCAQEKMFRFWITEIDEPGDTVSSYSSYTSACHGPSLTAQFEITAVAGQCAAVKATPLGIEPTAVFDAGTLTVENVTLGAFELPPASGGNPCQASFLPVDGAFSTGDTVTFSASGGADIPAFSLDVTAPEPIGLSAPPIQGGEPLVISWTASSPPDSVQMLGDGVTILCLPSLPGSLVADGSLTALLGSTAGMKAVQARRDDVVLTSVGGAGLPVWMSAYTGAIVETPFSP